MRFKRHNMFLIQIIPGYILIILLPIVLSFLNKGDQAITITLLICMLVFLLVFCLVMITHPGYFKDTITIDEKGILLISVKQGKIFFPWETITKILRSRDTVSNTFVVLNETGDFIWFYRSKKIEKYMIEMYPDIKKVISKKRYTPWVHNN